MVIKKEYNCIYIISYLLICAFIPQIVTGQSGEVNQSVLKLDGEWLFKTDMYNQGADKKWYALETDTSGWDKMQVPGNWDLKNEYADYVGIAWYKKTFKAKESWQGQVVRLYFESVYNDVDVWLNGVHIGEHHVGFLPFWFDIKENLNFGEPNTISLRVDNRFKRGAIWNWGGIRRPVWLEITDPTRLERQHITAIPDLDHGGASIDVEFTASSQASGEEQIGYELVILKDDEQVWVSESSARQDHISISPGGKFVENLIIDLAASDVELWHFNHPHLYTSKLRLFRDGEVIHSISDRFGIRKIELTDESFKLNGEPIRTVGFNLVPEDRITGNTLPAWRIKQDVDMMKSLGANMARVSHLPLPKEFLDYLDEKGIMTFEEVSLWGKDKMADPEHPLPKYWLEKMIEIKYNHPSVIGWSVGNEIGLLNQNPKVLEYVKSATERARELDPNRIVVDVTHSADRQETDPVKYSDMIMFNAYGNWGERVERAHNLHSGKLVFMSEYGDHLNDEDLNVASIDVSRMLNELRDKPFVVGASLWTFNDYRSFWKAGETWTTPPSQNRTWGIVDAFRQKKRPFYSFKREHSPVKHFRVETSLGQKAEITMKPRDIIDIPSYKMKGYHLIWSVADQDELIMDGNIVNLPLIVPGDDLISLDISWDYSDVQILRVDLLDPQQYSVRDTTIYFSPPDTPDIKSVHTAHDQVRVIFDHVKNATEYKAYYGQGELNKKTAPTINDYIEIDDLEGFANYQVTLVAINNAGESEPSQEITVRLDQGELPPIIRKTVPSESSFFVGYSVDRIDYMYEVKYGTSPGEYVNHIAVRNVGVLQVPGLENGQTYYYRMRNRKQWGFASDWTHEIAITPDGGQIPDKPNVYGVIRNGQKALIMLEPVSKAIGYKVGVYKDGKQIKQKTDNRSHVEFILLKDLSDDIDYEFSVKVVNKYGISEPFQVK